MEPPIIENAGAGIFSSAYVAMSLNAELELAYLASIIESSDDAIISKTLEGKLKQDIATAGLPVVMISAHPNAGQLCLDAGADDFIAKPFDMQDLLSTIGVLVEKGHAKKTSRH
jgi:hypothetical protein